MWTRVAASNTAVSAATVTTTGPAPANVDYIVTSVSNTGGLTAGDPLTGSFTYRNNLGDPGRCHGLLDSIHLLEQHAGHRDRSCHRFRVRAMAARVDDVGPHRLRGHVACPERHVVPHRLRVRNRREQRVQQRKGDWIVDLHEPAAGELHRGVDHQHGRDDRGGRLLGQLCHPERRGRGARRDAVRALDSVQVRGQLHSRPRDGRGRGHGLARLPLASRGAPRRPPSPSPGCGPARLSRRRWYYIVHVGAGDDTTAGDNFVPSAVISVSPPRRPLHGAQRDQHGRDGRRRDPLGTVQHRERRVCHRDAAHHVDGVPIGGQPLPGHRPGHRHQYHRRGGGPWNLRAPAFHGNLADHGRVLASHCQDLRCRRHDDRGQRDLDPRCHPPDRRCPELRHHRGAGSCRIDRGTGCQRDFHDPERGARGRDLARRVVRVRIPGQRHLGCGGHAHRRGEHGRASRLSAASPRGTRGTGRRHRAPTGSSCAHPRRTTRPSRMPRRRPL